jgi:glycosyltransferase involved in cell wall biosynthesis
VTKTERISVIVPMRNEAAHVAQLVSDIANQDFVGEIEVLVADGGSTDGSRDLLEEEARTAGLTLTIVENPSRIVSTGLNACISRASGELIVRLDCHSRYPKTYLSLCARTADETGAWNVGGAYEAIGRTTTERAVACALSSPFGGVNWTSDAGRGEPVDADTVYLGAFRPVAFTEAGAYAEDLVRNQDDELNLRIRQAGGRIVFDPAIRAYYVPRGSFRTLARQYFEYGFWKVVVMARHRRTLSGRSLAPLALVVSLLTLGTASLASGAARRLFALTVGLYATAAVVFGVMSSRRCRASLRLIPRVVAVFPTLHLSYGLGMVSAVAVRLRSRWTPRSPRRADDGA